MAKRLGLKPDRPRHSAPSAADVPYRSGPRGIAVPPVKHRVPPCRALTARCRLDEATAQRRNSRQGRQNPPRKRRTPPERGSSHIRTSSRISTQLLGRVLGGGGQGATPLPTLKISGQARRIPKNRILVGHIGQDSPSSTWKVNVPCLTRKQEPVSSTRPAERGVPPHNVFQTQRADLTLQHRLENNGSLRSGSVGACRTAFWRTETARTRQQRYPREWAR